MTLKFFCPSSPPELQFYTSVAAIAVQLPFWFFLVSTILILLICMTPKKSFALYRLWIVVIKIMRVNNLFKNDFTS